MKSIYVLALGAMFQASLWKIAYSRCGGGRIKCMNNTMCPPNTACLPGKNGGHPYCRLCFCAESSQCDVNDVYEVICNCSKSDLTGRYCECPSCPATPTTSTTTTANPGTIPITEGPRLCPNNFFPINDYCFRIIQDKVTFYEAQAKCRQLNAYLAEPRTANIENEFQKRFARGKMYWIGAEYFAQLNEFVWSRNYDNIDWMNWAYEQPSVSADGICVGLFGVRQGEGSAYSVECNTKTYYVCQTNAA